MDNEIKAMEYYKILREIARETRQDSFQFRATILAFLAAITTFRFTFNTFLIEQQIISLLLFIGSLVISTLGISHVLWQHKIYNQQAFILNVTENYLGFFQRKWFNNRYSLVPDGEGVWSSSADNKTRKIDWSDFGNRERTVNGLFNNTLIFHIIPILLIQTFLFFLFYSVTECFGKLWYYVPIAIFAIFNICWFVRYIRKYCSK